jgi:hypothetical protein
MSLVVRFAPESLTSDQYDHVVRRLNEENISPADGLDYEVCFGSGDKMKVSLVWDSKEQFDAFAERLMGSCSSRSAPGRRSSGEGALPESSARRWSARSSEADDLSVEEEIAASGSQEKRLRVRAPQVARRLTT